MPAEHHGQHEKDGIAPPEVNWAATRPDVLEFSDARGFQAVLRRSDASDDIVWRATGTDGTRAQAMGRAADLKSLRVRAMVSQPLTVPMAGKTAFEAREATEQERIEATEAMTATPAGRRHLREHEGGSRYLTGAGPGSPPASVPVPMDEKLEGLAAFIAGKGWERPPRKPQDTEWEHQVPGIKEAGPEGFAGTLHDPRAPFAVQWECEHAHPDWAAAEQCAVQHQAALAAEYTPAAAVLQPVKHVCNEYWEFDLAALGRLLGIPASGEHRAEISEDGKLLRLLRFT